MNIKELQEFSKKKQWEVISNEIYKKFTFKNFIAAKKFFDSVAILAEEKKHHPKVIISYNIVELFLSTHDEGKITRKDLQLATLINKLIDEITP